MEMWARNMFGQKLTDDQMKDIPQPQPELFVHVTYKTVQAGSILGMFLTAPLTTLIRGPRTLANLTHRIGRHSLVGSAIGLVAGPLMTHMKVKDDTREAIYDRCYRLRNNRNQIRVDQGSMLFGLGGAAAGAIVGPGLLSGAALGIATGTLVAAGYNVHHNDKHT